MCVPARKGNLQQRFLEEPRIFESQSKPLKQTLSRQIPGAEPVQGMWPWFTPKSREAMGAKAATFSLPNIPEYSVLLSALSSFTSDQIHMRNQL